MSFAHGSRLDVRQCERGPWNSVRKNRTKLIQYPVIKHSPIKWSAVPTRASTSDDHTNIVTTPVTSSKPQPLDSTAKTVEPLDGEAFTRVVLARRTERVFDSTRSIPNGVLEKCLGLAARAPTSFNMQPYVAIVVDSAEKKLELSKAMLGEGNIQQILAAPVSVVFCANNSCMSLLPKVVQMAKEDGAPEAFTSVLPLYVGLFSGGFNFLPKIPIINSIISFFARIIRKVALAIAGIFVPVPPTPAPETWSHKNTTFPATVFMLAATALGLATRAMEGFHPPRLRRALGIPSNYSIPVIVSVGYSVDPPAAGSQRLPPEELFYTNHFGTPFQGVPVY